MALSTSAQLPPGATTRQATAGGKGMQTEQCMGTAAPVTPGQKKKRSLEINPGETKQVALENSGTEDMEEDADGKEDKEMVDTSGDGKGVGKTRRTPTANSLLANKLNRKTKEG